MNNINELTAKVWNEISNSHYNANDVRRMMDKYYASRTSLRLVSEDKNDGSKVNINDIVATVWNESISNAPAPFDSKTVKKYVDVYYILKIVVRVMNGDKEKGKIEDDENDQEG